MEEASPEPHDVDRAKSFWAEQDVDQVFGAVFEYLDHLRETLKTSTASDKEWVQGLKLLDCLDWPMLPPAGASQVVQVVIGLDDALPATFTRHGPPSPAAAASPKPPPPLLPPPTAVPPAGREELLPPLTPVQLQYRLHRCCKTCLASLPSMPQSLPLFWGQNPLKVPLLCGFKRLNATPVTSPGEAEGDDHEGAEPVALSEEDAADILDVFYKAPCGQSLRDYDDVMHFLLSTESYDVLQVDFFTFNPAVCLDPPPLAGARQPELDLSRGCEPTPVELCVGPADARPPDFRYRKERWPHGCFLSSSGTLFNTCCDCTDGCTDAQRCACIAMTRGERHYSHQRLAEPVASGVFECGPWCGCDRARCQNRLVQRGIRVRLQVFKTERCSWGVRCRDDLDAGTFVCVYAGVILRRAQTPSEPPPPKLTRSDLPSDDEVEVVTEWLAPPVLEGRSSLLETPPPKSPPTSPPSHVPVIQRSADSASSVPHDRDKVPAPLRRPASPSEGDQSQAQERTISMTTRCPEVNGGDVSSLRSLKRAMKVDDVYLLDATKEGNVSRFFNHSCQPNMFIQNVFTDSHDPEFPVIAFFTSRAVKAGTELTWSYSPDTQSASQQKQEVPCLCGSDGCRGRFAIEENVCDVCEADGQSAVKAT